MTPHRLASATTVACFFLLLAGGLVHATGSGLACPDWPLCHGTAFPKMEGGVLFEHGHRLIALSVATLTALLCILLWRRASRQRWLATGAVGLVLVQALLGALTVWLRLPMLIKTVHLAVSVAFFCLLLLMAFRTSEGTRARPLPQLRPLTYKLLGLGAGAVYLQILSGALVRHTGSGLACLQFPLCEGHLWPAWGPQQLHMIHRMLAVAVAAVCVVAALRMRRDLRPLRPHSRALRLLTLSPLALVLLQIALGVFSVLSQLGVAIVTAHLGTGVLLLANMVALRLSAERTALGLHQATAALEPAEAQA